MPSHRGFTVTAGLTSRFATALSAGGTNQFCSHLQHTFNAARSKVQCLENGIAFLHFVTRQKSTAVRFLTARASNGLTSAAHIEPATRFACKERLNASQRLGSTDGFGGTRTLGLTTAGCVNASPKTRECERGFAATRGLHTASWFATTGREFHPASGFTASARLGRRVTQTDTSGARDHGPGRQDTNNSTPSTELQTRRAIQIRHRSIL
jgi:hypothetical protein